VLFCGADEFSIYSLKALDKIRKENPDKVASIDVVCRKDKRVGRGLKQIREGKHFRIFNQSVILVAEHA
jgi:methionyl-tRNA formyltransferase